jgi:DNA-binding transcriptional ArsR family regulator
MCNRSRGKAMNEAEHLVAVTQALADPLRLAVLRQLMGGPSSVSELVAVTESTQPNVSNHLALLRARGLVRSARQGRQVVYELRDPAVAQLVEALSLVAGGGASKAARPTPAVAQARTCYDHLAGKLGVALYDALVRSAALQPVAQGQRHNALALGPEGAARFGELGIVVDDLQREKRRFAFACLDWTERRPHLGGALGAALCRVAMQRGWVTREAGTRAVLVTEVGRAGFAQLGMGAGL